MDGDVGRGDPSATRVTCGPGVPEPGDRARRRASTVAASSPVGPGQGDDVGAVRRAEELFEALAVARRAAWGRNEKIPPPSLSTTTMREVDAPVAQRGQAPLSWTKAMSPTSATTGRPRRAMPRAVDTTPSMPLAPRFANPARRSARRTTRSHAPASTTPRPRRPRGRWVATSRATAGSVRPCGPRGSASPRWRLRRPRRLLPRPASPRVTRSSSHGLADRSAPRCRRCGRPRCGRGRSRRDRRPARPVRRRPTTHSASTLDAGGRPTRTTARGGGRRRTDRGAARRRRR